MPAASFSALRLIAWGALVLGGILLLSQLGRVGLALWRRLQPLDVWARYAEESSPYRRRRARFWSWMGVILVLLLIVALGLFGWSLLRLEQRSQAYRPFPLDGVVARIQCHPAPETPRTMSCGLQLGGQEPITYTLSGVRWGLEGEVLTWDPALERMGMRSGYRLVRLVGYDSAGQVLYFVDLADPDDGLGMWFALLDDRLPLVQARRQVASGEVAAGTFFELAVTRSGFSLQKWDVVQP